MIETIKAIERIASLKEIDIGPTEENVKQKVVVPLLEALGHKRENLEFEYRTRRGGKLDIYIKNVPPDCKVILDTKNYDENLNDHIEKMKEYTFDEAALLTVIANGGEIRIYSPLRGIAFERSLLYSLRREDLIKDAVWKTLSNLLHIENLRNKSVLKKIEEREQQIKDAMAVEEQLKQEYETKITDIDGNIATMEEKIEDLKKEKYNINQELDNKIADIWKRLDLPTEVFKTPTQFIEPRRKSDASDERKKARKITFQELESAGLVKDGQILFLYYGGQVFKHEQAQIVVASNKLKYKGDGKFYSKSELARILLQKHGKIHHDEVRGPDYWKTEDGQLLKDIEEQVRRQK